MIAAIKAIAELISGAKELLGLLKQAFALIRKAKREGWIEDGKEITKKVMDAKTDEERRKLVKKLAGHTRDTPN